MKPSAIICADMHIRETSPECRTDDFLAAQARKLKWLKDLQEKHNVPILVAGDLFDHWKPSLYLVSWCLRNLPNGIIAIPGQHDLPAHNLENIEKSGIQVLADAGKIILLTDAEFGAACYTFYASGYPWGYDLQKRFESYEPNGMPQVALIHYGVYESKPHYPGAELSGGTASSTIKKMKGFDLIVSGDNHLTFSCKVGKQLLINAGSFMRTTAAQVDHKPSVFLWYDRDNSCEQVFIPIEQGVVSREHIEQNAERDDRLEAFISQLKPSAELTVSFKDNLKSHMSMNKTSKSVSNLVWEAFI